MSSSYQDIVNKEVADTLSHFADEISIEIIDRGGSFFEIDETESHIDEMVGNDSGYSAEEQQVIIQGSDSVDGAMRDNAESMTGGKTSLDNVLDIICNQAIRTDVRTEVEKVFDDLKRQHKEDLDEIRGVVSDWLANKDQDDTLLSTTDLPFEVDADVLSVGIACFLLDQKLREEISTLNSAAPGPGVIGGQLSSLERKREAVSDYLKTRKAFSEICESAMAYLEREQTVRASPNIKHAEQDLKDAADALYSLGYQTESIDDLLNESNRLATEIARLEAEYEDNDPFVSAHSVSMDLGDFYQPMMQIIEEGEKITPETAGKMLRYISDHHNRTQYTHPLFTVLAVTALSLGKGEMIELSPLAAGYAVNLVAGKDYNVANLVSDLWVCDPNGMAKTVIGNRVNGETTIDEPFTQAVMLHISSNGLAGFRDELKVERLLDLVARGGDLDLSDKAIAGEFAQSVRDGIAGHPGFSAVVNFMADDLGVETVKSLFEKNPSEAIRSAVTRAIIEPQKDAAIGPRKNKI